MNKCKNCGKEYTKRNVMQQFCTTEKDGPMNCANKFKAIRDRLKKESFEVDPSERLDALSAFSAKVLKRGET